LAFNLSNFVPQLLKYLFAIFSARCQKESLWMFAKVPDVLCAAEKWH
jgi:hypothetical protein